MKIRNFVYVTLIFVCQSVYGCRAPSPSRTVIHQSEMAHAEIAHSMPQSLSQEVIALNNVDLTLTGQVVRKLSALDSGVQPASAIVSTAPAFEISERRETQSSSQSIDLTTALLMTTGQNPQIAFANARIEESLAQLDRANALKLPSIRAGVNYNKHEGRIQDVAGSVIETSRGSFYSGFGANAVGAGSPMVPGIVSQFHLADAIFQPRIAQRTVNARRSSSEATTNDLLLATAIAYTELLRGEQEIAVAKEVVEYATKLAVATKEFARNGEGLESDFDRARTELALRKNELLRAEELAVVASSKLAELIRWESTQRLSPSEALLIPIQIVDSSTSPQELLATALSHRPELAESRHLVGEAVERLNREKHAPLIPSVLLAASYGGLGGGLGSSLSNYGDRIDADAAAFWEVRQLGVGENAVRREAKARIMQARMRDMAQMDRIAREVAETHAQVTSRTMQIKLVGEAIDAAEKSYERNWDRIRNGKGLPIEVLQSIQALAYAKREYVRVVGDYNVAQFSLQRSLGWPISEPVNTSSSFAESD